jgi:N-acetylmuramoyl-L-alanine amidase
VAGAEPIAQTLLRPRCGAQTGFVKGYQMECLPIAAIFFAATLHADEPRAKLADRLERKGDEIMVCGQLYHTTTRIVLWTDPGGYDAYRVEPRFAPLDPAARQAAGNTEPRRASRFGLRQKGLTADEIEKVRGGGWDLPTLQRVVDQFVIHFDAVGTSKRCFQVLHDRRGLSVHFLLDLDGTIYQTLDAKESARHATIANGRSIGVEVANIGAYPIEGPDPLAATYRADSMGNISIVGTDFPGPNGTHILRPSRNELIVGTIQGKRLKQYDFTRQQYEALAKLAATLCKLFPRIRPDYPRDERGALVAHKLADADYGRYQGILGHYHVQTNKVDPGPAFQWEEFMKSTRELLK